MRSFSIQNKFWFIAVLALLLGGLAVQAPLAAWVLAAGLVFSWILVLPVSFGIALVLATLIFFRLGIFIHLFPAWMNFLHFPLVGLVFAKVWISRERHNGAGWLLAGIVFFLAANVLSAFLNQIPFSFAILNTLLWCEPFVFWWICRTAPMSLRQSSGIYAMIFAGAFMQLPLGLMQKNWGWLTPRPLGHGDIIQGTFPGLGVAPHMAGIFSVLLVLFAVSKFLVGNSRRDGFWLGLVPFGFLLPVLSDAKQVVVMTLVAIGVMVVVAFEKGYHRRVRIFLLIFCTAVLVFKGPLQEKFFVQEKINAFVNFKTSGLQMIADAFSGDPLRWTLGLGPGNSLSRLSLMRLDEYRNQETGRFIEFFVKEGTHFSPEFSQMAEIIWANNWTASATFAGTSSWLGLLGDLGLLGVLIYLFLFIRVITPLAEGSLQSLWAGGVGILAFSLGGISSWLEEPALMLTFACLAGLADRARRQAQEQPS